jgi:hypothetical protein
MSNKNQFILSMQEVDLEQWEEKLAEEQAWGLYSFNGRDLLVELREHVVGIESDCATKVVQLSLSAVEISDALVDLGVFPVQDIPAQPKSVQDGLMVASPILEHLWEEHASGTEPYVQNLACPVPSRS